MFVETNRVLTDIEIGFNKADAIPIVGVFSSALRIAAGKVQFTAGVCITFTGLIGSISGNNNYAWRSVVQLGCDQMIHGCLNVIRGVGTLLLASTGLNFLLLAQAFRPEGFAPVVQYGRSYQVAARV
ncbi:MAG: hypothetical protein H0U49_12175 [Parachlamydiaceae bacterium]|nr:hypothetical protein [Parachlamydiaceae bacterium]